MSARAPDGLPWPRPRILVSRREQRPYAFGWQPIMQPEHGERVAIHTGAPLLASLITRELEGPFPCDWTPKDRPLLTADYTLRHPENGTAMESLVLIETKRKDLASSLTHGHANLMEEMERMGAAKERYLIAAASYDDLIQGRCGCGSRVKSMIHCIESIAMKHRVQVRFSGSLAWAEYVTALVLKRAWCGYLQEHPEALRCARLTDEAEGVPAMSKATKTPPLPRVPMAPPHEQYDAPTLGLRGRRA